MTRNQKILIGAGAIALTSLLIVAFRRSNSKRVLRKVADEGYETAGDVLYPNRRKAYKTHYGPVLPHN